MSIESDKPFISVCIPAYKHCEYLERLLNSLVSQTFTNFEVIITDDSPDDSVCDLVTTFYKSLQLQYIRNLPSLGTPANWNEAMRHATGQWIKIIHDDDWLSSDSSLQHFVDAIRQHPMNSFFFCAYSNVHIIKEGGQNSIVKPSNFRIRQLRSDPVTLLSKNIIGPPSVVIHSNDQRLFYDVQLKWLVDMDFYIRYLEKQVPVYIDKPLINIGLNDLQVTKSSALVREVEIPEHFRILEKTGIGHLNNVLVYDAWWRLIRNLEIKNIVEIRQAGYHGKIPYAIKNIVQHQQKIPTLILTFGPASKSMMIASYLYNKLRGHLQSNSRV